MTFTAGPGTYDQGEWICASRVGRVEKQCVNTETRVQVVPFDTTQGRLPVVPTVGDTVLARVVRLSHKSASVDIIAVGDRALKESFTGVIRSQDVRSFDVDAMEIHTCFRPRDIVKAKVLALGDRRAYYLTTVEQGLGVISGVSKNGNTMVGMNEKMMVCKETGEMEERRVAV